MSINEWARAQRELLKLERDEETSQVADAIAQLTAQVTAVFSTRIATHSPRRVQLAAARGMI